MRDAPISCGARLNLPRDLAMAYCIGRMTAVTINIIYPLFYGTEATARFGMGRLFKLGIVRSFPRQFPSCPKWFALTREGAAWVIKETGCDPSEIRAATTLRRVNLGALEARNRFWASLILAARKTTNDQAQPVSH